MKRTTLILPILFLVISIAPCLVPAGAQTQIEMNMEAYENYKKSDDELNKVYKKILKKYKDDQVFLDKLKLAQRAWIKFRDAHVESIYPEEDKQLHYGSVLPLCYNLQLQALTEERTAQLKVWLDGIEDGDVCTGSVK